MYYKCKDLKELGYTSKIEESIIASNNIVKNVKYYLN